jgi:hypothetical protein
MCVSSTGGMASSAWRIPHQITGQTRRKSPWLIAADGNRVLQQPSAVRQAVHEHAGWTRLRQDLGQLPQH